MSNTNHNGVCTHTPDADEYCTFCQSNKARLTAWHLAADWEWINAGDFAQIKGGRSLWEQVDTTKGGLGKTVRLSRLITTDDRFRCITRYVDPDTPMELIKCK